MNQTSFNQNKCHQVSDPQRSMNQEMRPSYKRKSGIMSPAIQKTLGIGQDNNQARNIKDNILPILTGEQEDGEKGERYRTIIERMFLKHQQHLWMFAWRLFEGSMKLSTKFLMLSISMPRARGRQLHYLRETWISRQGAWI